MKNVVITGSTRGLGLCLAKEFLKSGCNVTVSGTSQKSQEAARASLAEHGDRAIFVPCDVRSMDDLVRLWDVSAAKWGRVDIWINNAGRNCPYEKVWETNREYVDAIVDTNLKGMAFGSQLAVKRMLAQGGGQIWNMEGLGSDGRAMDGTLLYGTTKRALAYFTKGLAQELRGTPVLAGRLSPGMMLTDFIVKGPDGQESPHVRDKRFLFVFNALADRPETVAAAFVPKMLANRRNDAHIVWLGGARAMARFTLAPLRKRKLL